MLEHFWSRWKKYYFLSLREHITHYKGRRSQHPSINDIVIAYEEARRV